MKKILPVSFFLAVVSTISFAQSNKDSNLTNDNSTRTNTSETTAYNSRIYNACAKEWVTLKGTVTYSIKEMRSDDRYFIMYDIDLSKITGVGETSGTLYKGGGHIKDKVAASYKNNHVVGNNMYKVKYRAPKTSITISEHAHIVIKDDDVKVEFNDQVETCK